MNKVGRYIYPNKGSKDLMFEKNKKCKQIKKEAKQKNKFASNKLYLKSFK
jgi:hypothetical protein